MASPMISRKELERLAALRSDDGILSVYLKLDPRLAYDRGQAQAKFKGALRRFERATEDEALRSVAEREKDRVLSFLEQLSPSGRGLAVFSSQPADVWEVVSLDVMVPTFVTADTTTNTSLLMQVLDEFPRFVVSVVQRDHAAIYTSEQRLDGEEAAIESEVPGRHDQGGWAQARFQRHIEHHVERHLKKVVDEIETLFYERPFNRLVVGGAEEAVNELLDMLPEPVSRRVVGTFPVDIKHQTEREVLDAARRVILEDERRSEERLIGELVDAAESGGKGAVGLEATIAAAREGRVHVLAIAEGATSEGWACQRCDYFAREEFERCPLCSGEPEPIPDVIERAAEAAYLSGAKVNVVFGEAREWLLARGGLGALLRY
jgi:peptide chain release factor subunit 1